MRLQGCDIQRGYLCGSMEALNVPSAEIPVRMRFLFLSMKYCIVGALINRTNPLQYLKNVFVLQVVTFWEGEIVDNRNYTFYTGQWDAS